MPVAFVQSLTIELYHRPSPVPIGPLLLSPLLAKVQGHCIMPQCKLLSRQVRGPPYISKAWALTGPTVGPPSLENLCPNFGVQIFPYQFVLRMDQNATSRKPNLRLLPCWARRTAFSIFPCFFLSLPSPHFHCFHGVSSFFSGKPYQVLRNTEFEFRQTCISICPPIRVTYVNSEELPSLSETILLITK